MGEPARTYGKITGFTFLVLFISTIVLVLITGGNLFLIVNFIQLVLLIPSLLIVFIILFVIKRSKHANKITKKKVDIICLIFAIVVILFSSMNYYQFRVPGEILHKWSCDAGQELCEDSNCSILYLEKTWGNSFHVTSNWGPHYGYFIRPNQTFDDRFEFYWGYDNFDKKLTMNPNGGSLDWEILLRLDVTSTGKMTTYYISSNNAPFDAEIFDGISWTAKK